MNRTEYQQVVAVEKGSIAEELEISTGDRLLAIDGLPVRDVLDYRNRLQSSYLELLMESEAGEQTLYEMTKEEDEDLGLTFSHPLMDGKKACRNRCLFCFVDQLPQGVRPSLRFKDDDFRLSFLLGNYVTLTNVEKEDWQRILTQRIAPLYISVHTTNGALRNKMMRNTDACRIISQLEELSAFHIAFHVQIVLLEGVNDGKELERTLFDLLVFLPHLQSIAIVPVGLTCHRKGLAPLIPLRRETAREAISLVNSVNQKAGFPLVFLGDECYTVANGGIGSADLLPPYSSYGDFHQLEDGVGMMRHFLFHAEQTIASTPQGSPYAATVATGKAAYGYLLPLFHRINEKIGETISLVALENRFFGPDITVSGLLTGREFLAFAQSCDVGECLFIPQNALRSDNVFLDDMTLSELTQAIGKPVVPLPQNGEEFVKKILTGTWRNTL